MGNTYQICTRCIMDTSDAEIQFNEDGFCNHCSGALQRMKDQLLPLPDREMALKRLVDKIKKEGQGKEYDCIIGVSGGSDSTMTAFWVKKLGLKPLAVHFDNGWDSELAVHNITTTLEMLDIELYTHVVDWEEFRDLQVSFLRASVPNAEVPTDHGITGLLFQVANRIGVRFILSGSNLATEAIMPASWAYYNQDLKQLKAIQKEFGKKQVRSLPTISIPEYFKYVFVKRIRQIPFLNYVHYDREEAKQHLAQELGWRDYGGKHYESVWTRFYQGYYLPVKFGFDKRRAHFSSMICSGLMTRDHALNEMKRPIYPENLLREDMLFVTKKFGLTQEEFDAIIKAPPKNHQEYPNHYFLFHKLRRFKNVFRKLATSP